MEESILSVLPSQIDIESSHGKGSKESVGQKVEKKLLKL